VNSVDIIIMGLKNLYRRKARTFLTILGVIIGTAAIIIMISIGLGIKSIFIQSVSQYGSLTMINVYPTSGGQQQSGGNYVKGNAQLTDKSVNQMSSLKNVIAAIPSLQTDARLISGKYVNNVSIRGVKTEHMKYLDIKTSEGRILQKGDEFNLVFGVQIGMNFYNPKQNNNNMNYSNTNKIPKVNVLKDKIILTVDSTYGDNKAPVFEESGVIQPTKPKAKQHRINVVGIIKEGNYDNDYQVYMNLDTVKKIMKEKEAFNKASNPGMSGFNNNQNGYQNLMVKVDKTEHVKAVQDEIKKLGYDAYSPIDSLTEVEKISNIIQLVLGGIAAISLFVASLGITNTMIMAIYERTREIGVMKVIGAQISDIKKMFLFEAAMIGLLGGIVGTVISFIISYGLNNVLASSFMSTLGQSGSPDMKMKMSIIPIWLVGFALVFTTIIGIVSGYYPAKRATKLSAIEAIKIE
jgi:putative ABC transport system permease protein